MREQLAAAFRCAYRGKVDRLPRLWNSALFTFLLPSLRPALEIVSFLGYRNRNATQRASQAETVDRT